MADVEKSTMQKKETSTSIKELKNLYKQKKQLEKDFNKDKEKWSKEDQEAYYERKRELEEELLEARARRETEITEANQKKLEENFDKYFGTGAADTITSAALSLKSKLESTMDTFLKTQESIAYNLNGTELTLRDVTSNLTDALAGTGIVRQEAVYNNLNDMVKAGIIYNVEQRAFLQTLSDDLGMMFNATDGSLVRLINLQRKDLTDERMAIQASLKTFLNQHYETSQYIINGFQNVSNSLLEAQSIMTSQEGMKMEATVQKWLGSLSSVGMSDSTIESLATAIGELGSGNLSALQGSNMQNLLVMGAAQSELSYADLLTQGITSQTADLLMQGIVKYISQMGENSSNVVKSEYARIFGLNISDIVAASQVGNVQDMGDLSTEIEYLLGSVDNYIYTSSKINNALENFMYEWATGVASDSTNYGIYRATDILSSIGSAFASGITVTTPKIFGAGVNIDLGKAIQMIPLLTTVDSLLNTLGATVDNWAEGLSSSNSSVDEEGAIPSTGKSRASSIFSKLSSGKKDDQYIRATGTLTGASRESGEETSGSMIIADTSTSDMANTAMTSSAKLTNETIKGEETTYDLTDLYNYLDENWQADIHDGIFTQELVQFLHPTLQGISQELVQFQRPTLQGIYKYLTDDLTELLTTTLPETLGNQPYGTYTRISEASNTVTIGNDLTTVFDLMMMSTMHLTNIYSLLYSKFVTGAAPANIASYDWSDSNLNWLSSAIPNYNSVEAAATSGGV